MSDDIDTLRDVTKTLIDSVKGYEKLIEISDDSHKLRSEFSKRMARHADLVNEFQARTRELGAEPVDHGGALGSIHRGLTEISTLWRDDESAALDALEDGEEHLISQIESKIDGDLTPETRSLLQKAITTAREAERFADLAGD